MMVVPSACNEAKVGDIAKVVLMPGDPLRAKYVAETYLKNHICFNKLRNMFGYTGIYNGKQVSVMGSGMGIPSMVLYAHELYSYYGVEAIIRIGSAGGLTDDVKLRDIVIATTASTDSAIVRPHGFPGTLAPSADFDMLCMAATVAKKRGTNTKVGPVFTSEYFYNPLPGANEHFRDMGMLALEMETAGLYITANRAGKKALSILTISDHVFTKEGLSAVERQESFHDMMEIALETAHTTI